MQVQPEPQPAPPRSLIQHLSQEPVSSVVSDQSMVVVQAGTSTQQVIDRMRNRDGVCALVVREDGTLAGIFTERDHLDKVAGNPAQLVASIDGLMTPEPHTLTPQDSVADALRMVVEGGYRQLPVVDGNDLLGVVAALDIVQYIADLFPTEVLNLPPDPDQIPPQEAGA